MAVITASPTSLTYNVIKGLPKNSHRNLTQELTLSGHTGDADVAEAGSAAWLAEPALATTEVAIDVTVDSDYFSRCRPGTYTETLNVTKAGDTGVDVPVTVIVRPRMGRRR